MTNLSLIYGGGTLLMLILVCGSHLTGKPQDRDRLYLAVWIFVYWLGEEMAGAVYGWEAVQRVAPAFDFGAGALLLYAWLIRPAWWKMLVVLCFWATCVAHLVYRLEIRPTPLDYQRYRELVNALYVCTLVITAGSGIWDVLVHRLGNFLPRGGRVLSRFRSGGEGFQ